MNNHKIDQIFKNGLDEFQVNPSDQVWDSLESQLNKSQNSRSSFIYKIAAGILLICSAFFVGYKIANSSFKPEPGIDEAIVKNIQPDKYQPQPEEASLPSEGKSIAENEIRVGAESENSLEKNEVRIAYENLKILAPVSATTTGATAQNFHWKIKTVSVKTVPYNLPETENRETLPPVTISYIPGNKMLDDDATSQPEKESTLRKAWDYALSVKNGEERPFNIKEMKNELFASDFRKKKSKSQD